MVVVVEGEEAVVEVVVEAAEVAKMHLDCRLCDSEVVHREVANLPTHFYEKYERSSIYFHPYDAWPWASSWTNDTLPRPRRDVAVFSCHDFNALFKQASELELISIWTFERRYWRRPMGLEEQSGRWYLARHLRFTFNCNNLQWASYVLA